MTNGQKHAKKYGKSHLQLKKERKRRRKIREYVLNHPHPWTLTQTELAKILGCSQATVSRDLTKMSFSKWNPFRQLERKRIKDIRDRGKKWRREWEQRNASRSPKERLEIILKLISKQRGGHWYPENSKPRGKPFSTEYQPGMSRWGLWPLRCSNCSGEGTVNITGNWKRGETVTTKCPSCGKDIGVTRPELPVEKRGFITPCGFEGIVQTRGRWHRNTNILFDCPWCGKEHHLEKHFTKSIN